MKTHNFKTIITWLCLLSFGLHLSAHTTLPLPWKSASHTHLHTTSFAQQNSHLSNHDHSEHEHTPTPAPSNDHHQDNHENTHHLTIQFRSTNNAAPAFNPNCINQPIQFTRYDPHTCNPVISANQPPTHYQSTAHIITLRLLI